MPDKSRDAYQHLSDDQRVDEFLKLIAKITRRIHSQRQAEQQASASPKPPPPRPKP